MDLMETHLPKTDEHYHRIIRALNRSAIDHAIVAKLEVEIFNLTLTAVRETIAMVNAPTAEEEHDAALRRDLDEALAEVAAAEKARETEDEDAELNVNVSEGITMEWRLPNEEEKKLIKTLTG